MLLENGGDTLCYTAVATTPQINGKGMTVTTTTTTQKTLSLQQQQQQGNTTFGIPATTTAAAARAGTVGSMSSNEDGMQRSSMKKLWGDDD